MKYRDIETLLHWAYRDELPKAGGAYGAGGGIAAGFHFAALGGRVYLGRGGGAVAPEPHPDALVIARAVSALGHLDLDFGPLRDWLAPDCGALVDDDDVLLSAMSYDLAVEVACHARMGMRPAWDAGPWRTERVAGANGRPVVVGLDARRRYRPGAHCPVRLSPDPREAIADRARYAAWYEGLVVLAHRLANQLAEHAALPPAAPAQPWVTGDPQPRVLADLSVAKDSRPAAAKRGRQAA